MCTHVVRTVSLDFGPHALLYISIKGEHWKLSECFSFFVILWLKRLPSTDLLSSRRDVHAWHRREEHDRAWSLFFSVSEEGYGLVVVCLLFVSRRWVRF
ncbi:hypothetical protein CPC08DRAFT_67243 [Agrocybe pediades]|nr:hypothetical protein CPC08DRAFT_67243 [Agrocybe pediades]